MTISSKSISKRRAAMAALLLLVLATASGCGTLPTQPSLDSTAADHTGMSQSGASSNLDPSLSDPGGDGGSAGTDLGPSNTAPAWTPPIPGPGNSDWGHSHNAKKPR